MARPLRPAAAAGIALTLTVFWPCAARAEDAAPAKPPASPATPAPAAKPAPPPTPEQATDAVLAAVQAKDDAGLKALAAKDDPDPWLVADELIRRGEFEVAEAFAKAAPRVDVEKLPAYVASRRGESDEPARRERLAKANAALQARKPADALAALGAEEPGPIVDVVGVRLAMGRGTALAALAKFESSAIVLRAAGDAAERLGWLGRAAAALNESGISSDRGSAFLAAREAFTRALSVQERRGDRARAAATLGNIGVVYGELGDLAKALATHERALAAKEELGDRAGAAATLGSIGVVYNALGDQVQALAVLQRALAEQEAVGDRVRAAATLDFIGSVQYAREDYAKALATAERALAAYEALGDHAASARELGNIGLIQGELGDYAKALATHERALAAKEALGDRAGESATVMNIGKVQAELGDFAKALSTFERALKAQEPLGDNARVATTLGNIGVACLHLGDYARALTTLERALAAMERTADRAGAARTLANIGLVQYALGDYASALSTSKRAFAAQEALGAKAGAAVTLSNIGKVHAALGDYATALSTLEGALAAMEALGDRRGMALTLSRIADVHGSLGEHAMALAAARRGVEMSARLVERLAEEEGARARDQFASTFEVGLAAAAAVGDAAEASWFLEQGRAGALRAALGSRQALEAAVIPESLKDGLLLARASERRALDGYRRVASAGDLARLREARRALDVAQAQVGDAEARIQREARGAAALTMGTVDDLDALRAHVAGDEALVLYGQTAKDAFALVVRPGGARIVALGPSAAIDEAASALLEEVLDLSAVPRGAGAAPGASTAPVSGIERLRRLVAEPLALDGTVRRVLVSPTGRLGFVPFALLFPDRGIGCVPSGTTYGLLLEEQGKRGVGVLALGDPDYGRAVSETTLALHRGGVPLRLSRLEASRAEVESIGTTRLLQGDATEAGLRAALGKAARWRAVHFACHGLLDTERPMFSSLALTADGEDDGFLTALEVFRMSVPADLVVMSACETGRGKVYKTEGIVGLTRAFMFAGAPRVICSLWKVDDEATRALMTRFYGLWNPQDGRPGLPTAEALRKAQELVRDDPAHPQWKHPYYWAAWVLWGMPS